MAQFQGMDASVGDEGLPRVIEAALRYFPTQIYVYGPNPRVYEHERVSVVADFFALPPGVISILVNDLEPELRDQARRQNLTCFSAIDPETSVFQMAITRYMRAGCDIIALAAATPDIARDTADLIRNPAREIFPICELNEAQSQCFTTPDDLALVVHPKANPSKARFLSRLLVSRFPNIRLDRGVSRLVA